MFYGSLDICDIWGCKDKNLKNISWKDYGIRK